MWECPQVDALAGWVRSPGFLRRVSEALWTVLTSVALDSKALPPFLLQPASPPHPGPSRHGTHSGQVRSVPSLVSEWRLTMPIPFPEQSTLLQTRGSADEGEDPVRM